MLRKPWMWISALLMLFTVGFGEWSGAAMAAEAPNDPFFEKQRYLQQIHAPEAWKLMKGKEIHPVTVAVVDTGVDLNHEDLKDRLVPGTNILQSDKSPQDDFGHGTAVAGVIAAVSGNGVGIAGMAPNAKIMPIKAVGSDGNGEEEHLGEGILHAVDHGADIVVLSLGLNLYSAYMSEIIDYADSKGVLLVAATGNKGQSVMYPAAYPKVIAVGGASVTSEYKTSSNFGPEVDIIAPWYVYTTANGNGYTYMEGTSMAAPQVAAAAAMMLGLQPELTPDEIRQRLRQSADPLKPEWNPHSGYGLLRADLALSIEPKPDMFEPNDSEQNAKRISVSGIVRGELGDKGDVDWFTMIPPYKGEISVQVTDPAGAGIPVALQVERGGTHPGQRFDLSDKKPVRLSAASAGEKVKVTIRSGKLAEGSAALPLPYLLKTEFHIYKDAFEPNDKAYQAYVLPESMRQITGTFHQVNDHDWFSISIASPGTLQLRVETDTPRIDPELYVSAEGGGLELVVDDGIEGETEFSAPIPVQPGTYYVRVRNVKSLYSLPVSGEYRLKVDFTKKLFDAYEPNNRSFQATPIVFNRLYKGVFDSARDEDWFMMRVERRSLVTLKVSDIPKDRFIYYHLYNSATQQKFNKTSTFGSQEMQQQHDLMPGVYFIRLMTDAQFQDREYGLKASLTELVAGFADITDHWARDSIKQVAELGVANGYGNYRFEPNRTITRAEAIAMLVRAFERKTSPAKPIVFKDVTDRHWAKKSIDTASSWGIVQGYPDGTFRPDEPISRAEMAAMAGLASGKLRAGEAEAFSDVPVTHWAQNYIHAFAQAGDLRGFGDGTFRPNAQATRAQFVALLFRLLK